MAEENNDTATQKQTDDFGLLQVLPIETVQNNVKEYGSTKYIQKFSNSIISRINDSISRHSEQGELDTQVAMSCLEICGDYPIQQHNALLQSVVTVVVQRYSAEGYEICHNLIQTERGIAGVMFSVVWGEEEGARGDTNGI